jgi:hypothetical protein
MYNEVAPRKHRGAEVMSRIVMKANVGNDGVLHLNLPLGSERANAEVQVTVETFEKRPMTADALLKSGLIGLWADREDIQDSREFARALRERAQSRNNRQ